MYRNLKLELQDALKMVIFHKVFENFGYLLLVLVRFCSLKKNTVKFN